MDIRTLTRMDFGAAKPAKERPSPYLLLYRYRGLLMAYMAALLFDTLSTIQFMVTEGIYLELHPLVRASSYIYGPVMGPFLFAFLFKLLAGLLLLFYFKHYGHYVLKAATATALLAGMYNLFQYWPVQ